jgi:Mg-chelatase subunit ChlD
MEQWDKNKELFKKNTNSFNFCNIVPLVDVSDSMRGKTMTIALGLGILISEINNPVFRDKIINFDINPSWIDLKSEINLYDKIIKIIKSSWCGTVNLVKAIQLIYNLVSENNLNPDEIPNLMVLTDMQFYHSFDDANAISNFIKLYQKFIKHFNKVVDINNDDLIKLNDEKKEYFNIIYNLIEYCITEDIKLNKLYNIRSRLDIWDYPFKQILSTT